MGTVSIEIALNRYGGSDIYEVAEALAKAEGYHTIVWLKKSDDWKNDQFGCCYFQQEVRQYHNSSNSIVYDDGMALSDEEVAKRAMENAMKERRNKKKRTQSPDTASLQRMVSEGLSNPLFSEIDPESEMEGKSIEWQLGFTSGWKGEVYLDKVKKLIENGAEINSSEPSAYPNATPLIAASSRGNLNIVKVLIENGADVNLGFSEGYYGTPIFAAVSEGHAEIVSLLLKNGANPNVTNKYGESTLVASVKNGSLDIAKDLLDNGVDLGYQKCGLWALSEACAYNRLEIAKILISKGININMLGNKERLLFIASEKGYVEVARILINDGVSANATMDNFIRSENVTALMAASTHGHIEIVKILLSAGARVETKLSNGLDALGLAKRKGHINIVGLLSEVKIDGNNKPEGNEVAPRTKPSEEGYVECLKCGSIYLTTYEHICTKERIEQKALDDAAKPIVDKGKLFGGIFSLLRKIRG